MISRRGFMGSILALAAAPAIVRADSLMRIVPRDATLSEIMNDIFYSASFPEALLLDNSFIRNIWVNGVLVTEAQVYTERIVRGQIYHSFIHDAR